MTNVVETTETTNGTKAIKLSHGDARRLERIFVLLDYPRGTGGHGIMPTLSTVLGQGRTATLADVHALKRIGAIDYEDDPSLDGMRSGRYTKITLTEAGRAALHAILAAGKVPQ